MNFLITQTELYAHFMARKITGETESTKDRILRQLDEAEREKAGRDRGPLGHLVDTIEDNYGKYWPLFERPLTLPTGSPSAVGNVSGYRCMSDCRSRGREFDPCPVTIDHEIISTVILLPSAESFMKGCCQLQARSVCTKYWLTACSSLPRKKCG